MAEKKHIISRLRAKKGLTQKQVADMLGISDKAVSKWERGVSNPDPSVIPLLAVILDTDADDLIRYSLTSNSSTWQGMLELDAVKAATLVEGRALADVFLCYFVLAGISRIHLVGKGQNAAFLEKRCAWYATLGLDVRLHESAAMATSAIKEEDGGCNVLYMKDPPFLYGTNLTKRLKNAMMRSFDVTVVTAYCKSIDAEPIGYSSDERICVPGSESCVGVYKDSRCLPIAFCADGSIDAYLKGGLSQLSREKRLFIEPLRRGTICFDVADSSGVQSASMFLRLLEDTCDEDVYLLERMASCKGKRK